MQPDGIVIRLIEALGYSFLDNDFHAFNGSDADLAKGEKQIAEVVRYLKMTPEQKAKEDLLRKNKAEYAAKQKKDAELKRQYEEKAAHDRQEKKHQKIEASHANELKFGANVKKFEPPAASRGG